MRAKIVNFRNGSKGRGEKGREGGDRSNTGLMQGRRGLRRADRKGREGVENGKTRQGS